MPHNRKKRIKTNKSTYKKNNTKSSYKQIAYTTKGFSKLHWGNCLFPGGRGARDYFENKEKSSNKENR